MLLGLTQNLALLLLGDLPQANAGSTVNGQGSGGPAPAAGGGGNAAPGSGGNPQGSPPNPVPAPPGFIQPQEFYTLDENDPAQRFTGVQAREAFTRAGQFDGLQSEFHRQTNELAQERQARQTAEQQLQEIQEQGRLENYMQQIGYTQSAQPGSNQGQSGTQSQQPPQQQPAQQAGAPGVGADADDGWLSNFGMQGPGQPPVQAGSPGAAPQTNSAQGMDPRQMALMMKAIVQEELSKTLTPVQQQIPQAINNAVDQRFNQQAQQDNVRNSFQAGREQLSSDLNQKWGIDPNISRDILDKWSLSSANYEEASRLMQGTYADDNQRAQARQLADQKIQQGNMFFNAAIQDSVQAAQDGQAVRAQQDAQQQLLSGTYVDMGDLAEPNRNIFDPKQVDQANMANLQKAMEIAETQGRLQAVAGPTGPAVDPSGFMQPQFIQPGQPAGYMPPTQPAQGPTPGPVMPQGQPNGQVPGWGAFQQQGYGPAA